MLKTWNNSNIEKEKKRTREKNKKMTVNEDIQMNNQLKKKFF